MLLLFQLKHLRPILLALGLPGQASFIFFILVKIMRLLQYALVIAAICLADGIILPLDINGHLENHQRRIQLYYDDQGKVVSKILLFSSESSCLI